MAQEINDLAQFERCVILYGKQAAEERDRPQAAFERCVILYGKQADTISPVATSSLRGV